MIKDEHAAAAAALVLLKAVVEISLQGAEGLIGDLRKRSRLGNDSRKGAEIPLPYRVVLRVKLLE